MIKRILFVDIIILISILSIISTGCSLKGETPTTSVVSSPKTTPGATASAPPKAVAKPAATPKLEQTSFSLEIIPPETYEEYTLPVYLKTDSVLHMIWTTSGTGNHIRMAITTPEGQYIGITKEGEFTITSPEELCDELNRSGSIIIKPSEQDWVNGYYIFHPNICDKDYPISIKLLYWIE